MSQLRRCCNYPMNEPQPAVEAGNHQINGEHNMEESLSWGEFDFPSLLEILRDYLPRQIEFYEVLIDGEIEPCLSLDDIEMICRAILAAIADGVYLGRISPMVPRARMMLEEIESRKLNDARA
jgi:hypothetical protein